MATINANTATPLSTLTDLESGWAAIDLGSLNSFYLIGIKYEKLAGTIDSKDVKLLTFEVGVEYTKNDYLSIGHITLNFDEYTSKDNVINKATAMTRCLNYPSVFYIRPSCAITYDNVKHTKGTIDIGINLNAVKLK